MTGRRGIRAPAPLGSLLEQVAIGVALGLVLGASALVSPLLPPVLALVGTAVALLLALPLRPVALLYALIVAIPFTSAMPRGSLLPLTTVNELVLLAALTLGLVYALLARRGGDVPTALAFGAGAFVIGGSVSPLLAYTLRGIPLSTDDVLSLLAPLQYPLLLWLGILVLRGDRERRFALQLMIACGSLVALVGLLQASGVEPVAELLRSWYPSRQTETSDIFGRVTSVLGAWNALGLFLLTILLMVAAVFPEEPRPAYRLNMRLAAALAVVCLLATNLYSGILGAALGYLLIKTFDPRDLKAIVPLAIVASAGAVVLLPELTARFAFQARGDSWIPQTLTFRWDVWTQVYFPEIAREPLWGVRPTFEDLAFPSPESQYVYYLYRSGGISLLGHALWLGAIVAWGVRTLLRRTRDLGTSLVLLVLALVVVYSVIGIINPVFTYSGSIDYFWLLLGIAAAASRPDQDARPGPPEPPSLEAIP